MHGYYVIYIKEMLRWALFTLAFLFHCYDNLWIDSANWLCVLNCNFWSCMENSHRNFRFCPWCTASSFLSGFSLKMNGYGALVSGICMLSDTKFHRLLIPPAFHGSWPNLRQTFRQQTCFFFQLDMVSPRIALSFGSTVTQSQTYSG